MRLRPYIGLGLIRGANLLKSLVVALLTPDDLIEFNKMCYSRAAEVNAWGQENCVAAGLRDWEEQMVAQIPPGSRRWLVLGSGGGRETIALAQKGFTVTGVDFVDAMVRKARENAQKAAVAARFECQEIGTLDLAEAAFDVVLLSSWLYSTIPSRERRVQVLRKLGNVLATGGTVLCSFLMRPGTDRGWLYFLHRVIALFTLGNLHYQPGDAILRDREFVHFFAEDEIRAEATEAGFLVEELRVFPRADSGYAILRHYS